MNNSFLHYPHKILDLEPVEIGNIVINTLNFSLEILEQNLPELISEINQLSEREISTTTINNAQGEVEKFTDSLHNWFIHSFIVNDGKWNYRKDRASRHYLNILNSDSALVHVYESKVICLPLFEAFSETALRIFDYSISKSTQMKYTISKSNNFFRKRILSIKSKRSIKYYFIKTLHRYGASEKQLVENINIYNSVYGNRYKDVKKTLENLPPLYHKEFPKIDLNISLSENPSTKK